MLSLLPLTCALYSATQPITDALMSMTHTNFAKTPATSTDSKTEGGAATPTDNQGKPAQGGATSDVVQISKKEYADLLSAKGYLQSFQSSADKKLKEQVEQINSLQTELEKMKKEEPLQKSKSAFEQILEQTSDKEDNEDIFADAANGDFLKQALRALQTDIDTKLSARDAEIQRLNNELQKTKEENITASRTWQRKLNIDNAMNLKVEKLMRDNHISREAAEEFLRARETAITALQDARDADDSQVGQMYSLVDDIIDSVAERKIKLAEHKAAVEKAEAEEAKRIKTLLEGKEKPTQVVLNLNKKDDFAQFGLSEPRKGESREDMMYRQLRESLAKATQPSSGGRFK